MKKKIQNLIKVKAGLFTAFKLEYEDYVEELKGLLEEYAQEKNDYIPAESFDAEDFLNKKDIWNHPYISDRTEKISYEVAILMAEFTNFYNTKTEEVKECNPNPKILGYFVENEETNCPICGTPHKTFDDASTCCY